MKILPPGTFPLAVLRRSIPDYDARLKSATVIALAESFRSSLVMAPPLVRQSDAKVLAGRDRVAAHEVAGWTEATCRLVDCTDEEARRLEIEENLLRRQYSPGDLDRMRSDLYDMVKGEEAPKDLIFEEDPDVSQAPPRKPGRKRNTAIDRVAQITGRSRRTVQRSIKKANSPGPALPDRIADHGLVTPPDDIAQIRAVVSRFDRLISTLAQVSEALQADLSRVDLGDDADEARDRRSEYCREITDRVAWLRSRMVAAAPAMTCPICCGHSRLRESCVHCLGANWISADAATLIDRKLLENKGRDKLYPIGGKLKKLSSVPGSEDLIPPE